MVGRRLKDSFRNSSIGVQMVKHVTIDRGRRALLGATGALALQGIFRSTAAVGQAAGQTASGKMKIGIIGAGHIGGTIGELWIKAGHPVFFSSRHPEELKELVDRLAPLAQAGTVDQAIGFGNVAFLAVPYGALPQIRKPCRLRRDWCAMPASIPWRSASSRMRGASSAAHRGMART